MIQRRLKMRSASFQGWRWPPPGSHIWRAKRSLAAQSGSWTSHQAMMVTLIDPTRSTSHSLEYRPGPKPPTQNLQGHPWRVLTRMNCLMSRQHWSLIVICHSGTLRGSPIDLVVNAMPNKEAPMSSALLGLPRALKALLLQHTGEGISNMVGPR
jgi:hypothetical protein